MGRQAPLCKVFQRSSKDLFRYSKRVHVGSVKEVDSKFESSLNNWTTGFLHNTKCQRGDGSQILASFSTHSRHFGSPNVMAPKHILDTLSPVFPNLTYCIFGASLIFEFQNSEQVNNTRRNNTRKNNSPWWPHVVSSDTLSVSINYPIRNISSCVKILSSLGNLEIDFQGLGAIGQGKNSNNCTIILVFFYFWHYLAEF